MIKENKDMGENIMRIAIFPGSFNPLHLGHRDILIKAGKVFDKIIIAKGINSQKQNKDYSDLDCILDYDFYNFEVIKYTGTLKKFIDSMKEKPCAIIKGLRNTVDFEYEKIQQYYNEDLGIKLPVIYFISDRNIQHMSGTGERIISEL